jgi:hypothetical protein
VGLGPGWLLARDTVGAMGTVGTTTMSGGSQTLVRLEVSGARF